MLAPISLVLARTDGDAGRFADLGVAPERIRVAGNIKYDLKVDPRPLPWQERARGWAGDRPVVVAGSTMEGEERDVLDAVANLGSSGPFLILAPRHPERFAAVERMLSDRGLAVAVRSRLDQAPETVDVLLVDTIGELSRAYGLAAVAFIGGSLVATGGHNPLEPAVHGVPVLTGPHVHNFREIYDELIAAGGARVVGDGAELAAGLGAWLADPGRARAAGRAALTVVEANRGATCRTVAALLELAGLGDPTTAVP
jgi:3-deoxy-D-manno-octulosonic-acid transferase